MSSQGANGGPGEDGIGGTSVPAAGEGDSESDFATQQTKKLGGDVLQGQSTSGLAAEVAREYQQRNNQRGVLFGVVVGLVLASFVTLLAVVLALGFGWMNLPSVAAVAAISALGVQPFVLIGVLTGGVFGTSGRKEPTAGLDAG
jgi:hypothetical protein